MEILGKIFGSEGKVKMMRLFLLNPGNLYKIDSIVAKTKTSLKEVKKELSLLNNMGLIKSQKVKVGKKKIQAWTLNDRFIYITQLQSLLINTIVFKENEIAARLAPAGRIKLVILAGVFLQNWDSRADLLVVGDKLKESKLRSIVAKLESEIGKELHYAYLETADFQYRMSVGDKLVRDVFDYRHHIAVDKIGLKQSLSPIISSLSTPIH